MGFMLRNDTRAKAETLLSVVAFDEFISAAIFGLIGPRANMQGYVRFEPIADIVSVFDKVVNLWGSATAITVPWLNELDFLLSRSALIGLRHSAAGG